MGLALTSHLWTSLTFSEERKPRLPPPGHGTRSLKMILTKKGCEELRVGTRLCSHADPLPPTLVQMITPWMLPMATATMNKGECKPGGSCEGLKPGSGAANHVDARCVSFTISPWSFGIQLSVTIRKPLRLFTCKRKAVALAHRLRQSLMEPRLASNLLYLHGWP